jgi:hypothetical protein
MRHGGFHGETRFFRSRFLDRKQMGETYPLLLALGNTRFFSSKRFEGLFSEEGSSRLAVAQRWPQEFDAI